MIILIPDRFRFLKIVTRAVLFKQKLLDARILNLESYSNINGITSVSLLREMLMSRFAENIQEECAIYMCVYLCVCVCVYAVSKEDEKRRYRNLVT